MPVNPYDDRKVTPQRPHGIGDLDIVRTSYTRRKANVTEALTPHNDKFEKNRKPVARRHIAVASYDPRTGTAR